MCFRNVEIEVCRGSCDEHLGLLKSRNPIFFTSAPKRKILRVKFKDMIENQMDNVVFFGEFKKLLLFKRFSEIVAYLLNFFCKPKLTIHDTGNIGKLKKNTVIH